MIVGCWNIRGLNCPSKQGEISKFVLSNHIDVLGIIESKVRIPNQENIQKHFLPNWNFITNSNPDTVDRIWVGWNPDVVCVTALLCSSQVIHVNVSDIAHFCSFFASFVYGYNTIQARRALWRDLRGIATSCGDFPWISLGDFNVVLDPHEIFGGNSGRDLGAIEFSNLVNYACLQDLRYTGLFFTWSNSSTRRKLDRALVNPGWLESFPTASANFLPPGISDHSPIVVNVLAHHRKKGMPFKFYNCWASLEHFPAVVQNVWLQPSNGNFQFQLFLKLKSLKFDLKKLAKISIGNEKIRAQKAREDLMVCQRNLDLFPSNSTLQDQERTLHIEFLEAIRLEEEILRQKSRIHWLESGDRNTTFFHHTINNRRNRKRIVSLIQPNGNPTLMRMRPKLKLLDILSPCLELLLLISILG